MIKILYFARLAETLGSDSESIEVSGIHQVSDVLNQLRQRDDTWQQALADPSLLIAVNQEICKADQPLKDGDELAFFPPVTGG